jgi:glycosyltransferase involved in cell wall biosynthesis
MHGLIAEEYKYIHQEQYDQKQYNTRLKLQEEAIQRSQTVVCVSNSFKKYLEKTHHYSPDRVFSIPMMVDTQSFYFDLELRLKKRKELNLTDKLVFVYSGSLFRWQMIDKVFEIFKIIFDNIYSTHLMILTNDELEIENILYEYNLSVDSVSKYDLEFTEVNSYLNTCDYGFLLRENHIVNNVASPTKYSEYLRCGVKLILTEGIGDFSKLAEDENFGIVLKNLNNSCIIKNEIQNSIGTVTINEKMRCSERISKLLNRDTILEEEIINKIYL